MKLYITKPKHTKYGRIPLDNPFKSVDELIEKSIIWLQRPFFEKPFIDIFGDEFCLRSWNTIYHCYIPYDFFPEGEVKYKIRDLIKQSISADFYETISNRHYKWIGEIDVDLIRRNTIGNFNLYLTKPPTIWDIQYAGIDRAKIFFSKPSLESLGKQFENETIYYIEGRFFRKTKELEPLCMEMWQDIKKTFNISDENFLCRVTENDHKYKQGSSEFIKDFFFDLKLKND